tara:strand:- start:629 stop:1120 length:492 start_codon:yes stop_codon:yes gene_type:complete
MIIGPPMLTHSFLKWLSEQDTKDKIILEFGSGGSTIHFSKIFKQVISLESNEKFRLEMMKQLPNNASIYDLTFDMFPNILNGVDYVLIDNSEVMSYKRRDVAINLIEKYNYKNTIILDNGNWDPNAYFYLKKMCNKCTDYGWSNTYGQETITSVFTGIKYGNN